jgi:cobaltochelatase CobS
MRREVRKAVRRALAKAALVEGVLEVRWPDDSVSRVSGRAHAELPWVVQLAVCRKNILLVGPAGSGKTHLAAQVAQAMGLPFAFVSCTAGMSEGQLLGRLLPTGSAGRFEYVRSDFIRLYEEGGVFLFDEIDAADPNTLLIVNAALANGHVALPNRPENPLARRHPDFVAVAAANTFGTGADRQYVGRNQLDESTLDRFRIGQVEMDYDPEVEKELCPDDALRQRLLGYRARVREAKLRRVVSTRFLRDAFDMKRVGASDEQIDAALTRGWSREEIAKV